MLSNFVVLYRGREGSTAIISSLSGQKEICVPVKEELDGYQFKEKHAASKIYKTLADVFARGVYPEAVPSTLFSTPQIYKVNTSSVGFKWRLFGDPQKLSQIFSSNNVTVFQLSRRSFLDLVCSSYVHSYANKIQSDLQIEQFPQFQMTKLAALDRDAYSEKLSNQRFRFIPRLFFKSAKTIASNKMQQVKVLGIIAANNVKIKTIYYEDFDADPDAFIKSMMNELGLSTKNDFNSNCDLFKVHKRPISERIIDLQRLHVGFTGRRYKKLENKYDDAINRIEQLSSG